MSGRKDGMSRQLNKLKNLVSEIEEIQRNGRGKAQDTYRAETIVQSLAETLPQPQQHDEEKTEKIIQQMIEPEPQVQFKPIAAVTPIESAITTAEGKVSLELAGNVAVKLKLEESNEIIEVRRVGDHLAISFADGKSVHLPLKSVA